MMFKSESDLLVDYSKNVRGFVHPAKIVMNKGLYSSYVNSLPPDLKKGVIKYKSAVVVVGDVDKWEFVCRDIRD